ncbi:tRNA (adenosine(37)-N6)-dimethylallyltransferase MiaA [Gillisia hiemivivida]|uniref:tRNA dimethylallyltransferase n=1 Tax=Gillisia hiemivivida TaxID=291190 RepID=A0A5C6ZV95_9FLAO|nr:tRNA (adenosine(37)-N6)-dimethylallyltransferase MiaA [Gillisia hiemivivida]TXD94561.1 tRNA (adenosine(37)-N6)-dimethylallyltransferase MiaA [Gillisia hiemivivida]
MKTKLLISIVGPTAIGKTALSIKLAQTFCAEILSADSRQFYKEIPIGTAAPSTKELAAAPHHFIHNRSIEEDYSVGDYEREAIEKLDKLFEDHELLVLVGGSGLYIKSLIEGLDNFPEIDQEIREQLNDRLLNEGLEPLKTQLEQLDPEYYNKIDHNNPHRVIRALEVCIGSGKTFSSFLNQPKPTRDFKTISIGLSAPREEIYECINQRVDIMMDEGLLEEAQELYPKRRLNALNTVGYKELFSFFEGRIDLETAVEEIKMNSRRYAKRQLTWFRKNEETTWFNYKTPFSEIENFIKSEIQEKYM